MAGPHDPAAGGGDRLRAGHADRERVIEALKVAFVQGRLTRGELDTRAGEALSARTRGELAALTADIPAGPPVAGPSIAGPVAAGPVAAGPVATGPVTVGPAAARPARPPAPVRRQPLARAAAGSASCLALAFAVGRLAGVADPGPPSPSPYHSWAPMCILVAFLIALAALGILVHGVGTAWAQRRSRRQLPPPADAA
jgi:hypothetical protein